MLIVLVFGVANGDRLDLRFADERRKAEAVRAEWDRVSKELRKEYQQMPAGQNYIAKQATAGTCIPRAERNRRHGACGKS